MDDAPEKEVEYAPVPCSHHRVEAALNALLTFGTPEDFEEGALAIAKVAAKAMRRKS